MAGGIGGLVNIGMLGGSPLMKVRKVIGEFLPLTKSLDGGALGGLMGQLMNGTGLQAILANPLGAIAGQLQGMLGNVVGQLTGALGDMAGGLVSALTGAGGLGGALGGLLDAGAGLLSGQGIMGMIGHANLAEMVGSVLPSALGIDAVLGPLTSGDLLGGIVDAIPGMIGDVIGGVLPIDAAIGAVMDLAGTITGVVDASAHALTTLAGMAPDIAAVSSLGALLVSAPDPIQAVLNTAILPEARTALVEGLAGHVAEDPGATAALYARLGEPVPAAVLDALAALEAANTPNPQP